MTDKLLNVMAKRLALLLHILEVAGSNPSPETDYPESLLWISSVPPGKFQYRKFPTNMILL
jgi:hypothetical protein